MSEVITEVKTYTVDYQCDECDGEVVFTGTYNATHPPKCHHQCTECKKTYTFFTTYPKTIYRRI